MSYKFNRNCWVESFEERLFCSAMPRNPVKDDESCEENSRIPEIRNENAAARLRCTGPASIEETIAGAGRLFAMWGDEFQKEERIRGLICRLEMNLENSRRSMRDLGIFRACARCDETAPEGSCCSQGLERKYGPVLLLANLLLGVRLPGLRQRPDSCYFLGPKGCGLKARHMLCVDYLCPELENALGAKSLIEIQTVSGEEIETAFLLHEAIKAKIRTLQQ